VVTTTIRAICTYVEYTSLKITGEYTLKELAISETKEMLTAPASAVYNGIEQIFMSKSIVPDPGWFDDD